ncbi:MAG: hypothetical protein JWN86_851 [Planctomycetota bacterium]|nr:hypothetical protein [Planctomycetota bacterium]
MPQDERNYYAEPDDSPDQVKYRRMPPPPASGISIASLVCGVCFCVPLVTSLLAVIFGFIGIRKTRDPEVGGRGLAIAGLVMGVIGLSLWLVVISFFYILQQTISVQITEAQSVAHQFVQDLSEGKVDAAVAHAVPELDRKELVKASTSMKAWGPFNEIVLEQQPTPLMENNMKSMFDWELRGRAIFNRAEKPVRIRLLKDGSTYRIEKFEIK